MLDTRRTLARQAGASEPHAHGREARERIRAVVAAALDDGRSNIDVETLDSLAKLIAAAGRWQLVAELGLAS